MGGHENLRPNDLVPVPGTRARAQAVSGITDFCKHLQTAVPSLDTLLPMSLFPESGNLLVQLSRLSKFLSRSQHVRIVDKGAGEMWGFCAWLWDQVEDFMRKEKFTPAGCTVDQWNTRIARVVNDMGLQRNPKGRLCILYVLAKAKSPRAGKWVFRGIFASPAPVLNGQQLRLAARSFTCMLRLLQREITHNFQCADIKQVAGWFRFISQKGAVSLTEMDCKKQFDNINPRAVLRSFKEASNWIYKKRRWRQVNVQWSVRKESAKLDRAGQATNTRFWCITHDLLSRLLKFELTENNMLQAVGTLWKREGAIPMGGPFSAQSADLHTLWKVKRAGKKLRDWGELNISDEGYIYWQRGPLWFSLCQFRDNILFASNHRPGAHTSIIQRVTETLSIVWDLEVLCPCTDGGDDCCVGNCLTQTAQALGISMTVGAGVGLSSTHPSALKPDWDLRFGKPLMTPSRAAPEYLSCIFTSSLTSAQPWLESWSAQILSALSWVQVARVCDYKRMAVMRAMHKTVRRAYSASPWMAENTMRAVYAIGHHQPCPRQPQLTDCCTGFFGMQCGTAATTPTR